jgi:predicted acyl esterase
MGSVDKINARKDISILISKNYHDEMLKTNTSMDFYSRLTVPKKLILNEGVHLTAEIWGAWGWDGNYIFDEQVYPWFDYWLKNETSNNIMDPSKRVIMQIQGHEYSWNPPREAFAQWPDPAVFKERKFYLTPRLTKITGQLQENTYTSNITVTDTIRNGMFDTAATSGGIGNSKGLVAFITAPLAELFFPSFIRCYLPYVEAVRDYGVIYRASTHAQSTMKIRGIPTLKLRVTPSTDKAQIVAYLYDTDADGKTGTLITHGAYTVRDATPNVPTPFTMQLNMAAWDVPPEHTLTLVLDTRDVLYVPASNYPYSVGLQFNTQNQSVLTIPFVN